MQPLSSAQSLIVIQLYRTSHATRTQAACLSKKSKHSSVLTTRYATLRMAASHGSPLSCKLVDSIKSKRINRKFTKSIQRKAVSQLMNFIKSSTMVDIVRRADNARVLFASQKYFSAKALNKTHRATITISATSALAA